MLIGYYSGRLEHLIFMYPNPFNSPHSENYYRVLDMKMLLEERCYFGFIQAGQNHALVTN